MPPDRNSANLPDAISVDVEDYFPVEAFADRITPEGWGKFPLRVADNTRRVLDLFSRAGVKATFFVLGWVADREPGLVREIVNAEHEVGCHSYWHRRLWRLTPEEFRADTRRALACLRNRERAGAVVYLHPWELDPDQPRLEGRWRSRLRHYLNLRSVEKRLTGLLAHTTFVPRHEFLRAHGAQRPLRSISPGAV